MDDYSRSPRLAGLVRAVSPAGVRRWLRSAHQRRVFQRAILQFRRNPAAVVDPTSALIEDLIYGWGNEGWSAFPEFIAGSVEHALATTGAILECGSGLTTVLLGLVGEEQGRVVWSLENSEEWGARVQAALLKNHIGVVRLHIRPLRNFGEFCWYDPPVDRMPEFSLVICDGPPSSTPGGRYGLLPVMKSRLHAGAVVLLDDAAREHERRIASRWASEFGMTSELVGSDRPFVRLTAPQDVPAKDVSMRANR